jgi:hypothetical protein
MKRIGTLCAALCAMLAITAVAFAAQVNTYTVSGKVTPTTAGTKAKPVPVAVDFGYTVDEATGQRPALIKRYSINFTGLKSNGGAFPKCTADAINKAGDDSACPTKAVVGTGDISNLAGPTNDPANRALACALKLKVYNSGAGKAALYLRGGPPACPLQVSQAIPAKYVTKGNVMSLQFDVGGTLHHPVAGVDNAVVKVTSKIKKLTATVKGKKVGYYEAIGGCKGGKRAITVTFTDTNNVAATTSSSAACK